MYRKLMVLFAVATLAMTQGCLFSGNSKTIQPTVGQELTDLKAAHDKGALTDQEYNDKKLALLKEHHVKGDPSGKPEVQNASFNKH